MIVELNRGKEKIVWECQNGGQLWGDSEAAGYGTSASFPDTICGPGFQSLNMAFIVSLIVDIAFQVRAPVSGRQRADDGRTADVRVLPQLALHEAVGALPADEGPFQRYVCARPSGPSQSAHAAICC